MSVEIRKVRSDAERRATFHLRYQIYGALKWIEQSHFIGEEESDEYDTLETTSHFIALEDGIPVGTIRLVGQSHLPFPMQVPYDQGFSLPDLEDFGESSWEKVRTCEVSRLMVAQNNSCPRHALSLGLLQVLCRETVSRRCNYWLQALDALTYRLMLSYNFALKKYSPNKRFMGSLTVPTVMGVQWFFDKFRSVDRPMLNFFSRDIAPEDVVEEATKTLEARL